MSTNGERRDRRIAEEIAAELTEALGPIAPEALIEHRDTVCETFDRVFDRHQIITEDAGARILGYVPKVLAARNLEFAETNRQLDAAAEENIMTGVNEDQIGDVANPRRRRRGRGWSLLPAARDLQIKGKK